jgi:site-specific DNA recombinase
MTRAAIYCRISRDRTGAGLGVERQEADARALAERLGLEVAALYVDNDISASGRKPRPEYLRMLDDIRAGRIAAVIAWHTDRLHRSPVELETYISTCETHAVLTHTVQAGPIDLATPSGQLVARQLGAVARYEVDNGAKRQQRKKLETAAAGQFSGGRRPFGYEPDGVTVREPEAKVIAEVTDAILVGSSLRAQVARLNAAGATTSTGKSWTATELRRVLIRPRNAGLRQHRGEVVGKALWPAVVPEEKWRAVVSILTDPGRRTSFSAARRWLLSNLATCGVCGGKLRAVMLRGTRGSVPSYACVAGKCVGRNAAELERLVVGVIIQRLKRADAIDLLRPAAPEIDVAGLRSEEAALRQRLDDLADDLDLDERTLARRTRALNDRVSAIADTLAEAGRGNVLAGVVDAPDVDAAWERLDLDRKRAIIAFFADVVVHRTGKGRPKGWKPGQSYFDPTTVDVIGKV